MITPATDKAYAEHINNATPTIAAIINGCVCPRFSIAITASPAPNRRNKGAPQMMHAKCKSAAKKSAGGGE